MASNLFYNLLETRPDAPPADGAVANPLNAAEITRRKRGDGEPLTPPFTHGKIWVWQSQEAGAPTAAGREVQQEKLPRAPSMTTKEIKELLLNIPKTPPYNEDADTTLGNRPRRNAAQTFEERFNTQDGFTNKIRMLVERKTSKKRMREMGKVLKRIRTIGSTNENSRLLQRLRRINPEDNKNYEWLIELTTDATGKHSIFYTDKMKYEKEPIPEAQATPLQQNNIPSAPLPQAQAAQAVQNVITPKQTMQNLKAGDSYPTLKRPTNENENPPNPYAIFPINSKNKEWKQISKEMAHELSKLFKKDTLLKFPNPLYPKKSANDMIFKVSSYSLKFLPKTLSELTGKDSFKFFITNNRRDNLLYVVCNVHLKGRFIGKNNEKTKKAIKMLKKKPPKEGKSAFCDARISRIKNTFLDMKANVGIGEDSASKKWEKKMGKAEKSIRYTENFKLYQKNKKKAIDYYILEYCCRQAMNFNAGRGRGWPNVKTTWGQVAATNQMGPGAPAALPDPLSGTRYPFDTWTLQPGIPDTYRNVNYFAAQFGDFNQRPLPNITIKDAYRSINIPGGATAQDKPIWPIPFAPFGMSLKPKVVPILFERINKIINACSVVPLAAAAAAAAVAVGLPLDVYKAGYYFYTRRLGGKLPSLSKNRLFTDNLDYNNDGVDANIIFISPWKNLFVLYEYALYNDFGNNNEERKKRPYVGVDNKGKPTTTYQYQALETYKPYPSLLADNFNDQYFGIGRALKLRAVRPPPPQPNNIIDGHWTGGRFGQFGIWKVKKAEGENQGLIEFAIPKVHSNEWFTYPIPLAEQFALPPPLNHDWWQDFPTLISHEIPSTEDIVNNIPQPPDNYNDWRDFGQQQTTGLPALNVAETAATRAAVAAANNANNVAQFVPPLPAFMDIPTGRANRAAAAAAATAATDAATAAVVAVKAVVYNLDAKQEQIGQFLEDNPVPPRYEVTWEQIKENPLYRKEAKKWAEWMVLVHPFPIPGFFEYSDYIILRQKYILSKLSETAALPVPLDVPPPFAGGNVLTQAPVVNPQIRTQSKLRDNAVPDIPIAVDLPGRKNEWRMPLAYNKIKSIQILLVPGDIARLSTSILPSEQNRTRKFINPYALVSMNPAAQNSGWNLGFKETFKYDFPHPRFPWNRNKELFVGPPANEYPTWSSLPPFKESNEYENITANLVWTAPVVQVDRRLGLNYDFQFGVQQQRLPLPLPPRGARGVRGWWARGARGARGARPPPLPRGVPRGREQFFPKYANFSPHTERRRGEILWREKTNKKMGLGGWKGGNKTLKKKRNNKKSRKKNKSLKKKSSKKK